MFIINPLHAHAVDGLFRTHPSTEERIRRLQEIAAQSNANDDNQSIASYRSAKNRGPWS